MKNKKSQPSPNTWHAAMKGYKDYTRWNKTRPITTVNNDDDDDDYLGGGNPNNEIEYYIISYNNITIKASSQFAGAISSVKFNNKEFIDSYDHGRELQSALNIIIQPNRVFIPEVYNPTEAGSSSDATKSTSTSNIITISTNNNTLTNTTQMAYWLRPGETSSGNPALNTTIISNNNLSKIVSFNSIANTVNYNVTFTVPSKQSGESYYFLQFEVLTGYMPIEFSNFSTFQNNTLVPLSNDNGEQPYPILFSNNNDMTMGVAVNKNDNVTAANKYGGYGRFTFTNQKVQVDGGPIIKNSSLVKWNFVYRIWPEQINLSNGIVSGNTPMNESQKDYTFQLYLVIGPKSSCLSALQTLASNNLI